MLGHRSVRSRTGSREFDESRALVWAQLLITALQVVLVAIELLGVVGL